MPGVIPNEPLFKMLAARKFPVANFLRQGPSFDYSDEPDMFHDVFGHMPMFIDPTFGEFMSAYGRAGIRAEKLGMSDWLGRLYLPRLMRIQWPLDQFQPMYFVIESFEALLEEMETTSLKHVYDEVRDLPLIPVSDKPDEMLFIIMHQTMELWIKLAIHEANIAMEQLRADELGKAEKTLDRIATVLRHMIHSWEVLATLSPHDFLTFRGFLCKASGFQSHQYRTLEFCLGLKRADMAPDLYQSERALRPLHARRKGHGG